MIIHNTIQSTIFSINNPVDKREDADMPLLLCGEVFQRTVLFPPCQNGD